MRGALGPCDDQPMAKTVLIVDDHAPFRALARALLQLEGFEVVGEAGEMVVEDAPAVTLRAAGRTQTVPGRPHRRGVPWICNAAPAGPCPPAWRVGRSPATRPRAVTPGDPPEDPSARGDQPHGRIGDR
jgi:hypothetical protein